MLPPRSGSIEVEVDPDDVEVVEDEAPFALRQSQPPPRMQPMASAAPSEDPAARMRQALTRAEAHRRAKQYDQAVATLEAAVRELPVARELHEKLCDLLIESGDQDAAIRQMLTFADVLAKQGDVDGSARLLDEVLLLEPNQGRAMEMLRALGYSVPSEGYEAGEAMAVDEDGAPYISRSAAPTYDPEGPLPAYDLDEAAPAPLPAFGRDLDDPFTSDEPLPSYPIEDEATRYVPPVPFASAAASIPPAAAARPPPPAMSSPERVSHGPGLPAAPPSRNPQRATPAPAASQRGSDAAQLDEDALEEVEFFTSHGMFDEARAILDEQLSRLPNHPLLLERRRELDAAASGGIALPQESGARILPRSSIPDVEPSDDRSFDIAASLDALDALDALEAAAPAGPDPNAGTEQVSVEAVFEQFKAGVAAQISPSDAATHYDLGVAYREMGLYSDAIEEFKLASRDPGRECVCWSMIGWIQMEMGTVDTAIDSFVRGLKSTQRTDEHEVKLNYEVGNAYEMRNSPDHALYYFQRVARIDPHYYDPRGSVDDRIARLAPRKPPPAGGSARAVGAEHASDEFDAAFDDLLSRGGKLP
jgi:tetratricopeptide (TPR) repeat protein